MNEGMSNWTVQWNGGVGLWDGGGPVGDRSGGSTDRPQFAEWSLAGRDGARPGAGRLLAFLGGERP